MLLGGAAAYGGGSPLEQGSLKSKSSCTPVPSVHVLSRPQANTPPGHFEDPMVAEALILPVLTVKNCQGLHVSSVANPTQELDDQSVGEPHAGPYVVDPMPCIYTAAHVVQTQADPLPPKVGP
jgi:hypothetical protein